MTEKQKVILHLDPIEVIVEKTDSKELLLKRAKTAALEQLKEGFPRLQYSLVDMNVLSLDTVKPGMVVESDKGLGIITVVNKKTVRAVLSGNRMISGPAAAFKRSDKNYKEAFVPRRIIEGMEDYFTEGNCGYINVKGKEVPVVIGTESRGKFTLWSIEQPGASFKATQEQLMKVFK